MIGSFISPVYIYIYWGSKRFLLVSFNFSLWLVAKIGQVLSWMMASTPKQGSGNLKTKTMQQVFFLRILWHSQSGNHSKNNLAKFGYILDMKVEKKKTRILLYFWLPTGTYHKNLAIWKIKVLKIWRIWVIFFYEKSFV